MAPNRDAEVTGLAAADRRRSVQDVLVAALASGATHAAAGRTAGVSERTVRRRLDEPEFHALVVAERAALVGRTSARLTGLCTAGVDTLQDLLSVDVAPPVRLRAALGLLDAARAWRGAATPEPAEIPCRACAERDGNGETLESRLAGRIAEVAREMAERTPDNLRAQSAKCLAEADELECMEATGGSLPR